MWIATLCVTLAFADEPTPGVSMASTAGANPTDDAPAPETPAPPTASPVTPISAAPAPTPFQYKNTCTKRRGSKAWVMVPFDVATLDQPTRKKMTRYIQKINCSSSMGEMRRFHKKAYALALEWGLAHGWVTEAVVVDATKFGRTYRLPKNSLSVAPETKK